MKRIFPTPLLSLALLALWLTLNPTFGHGNLAIAVAVALGTPILCAPLRPITSSMRSPGVLLRLALSVAHDVVVSSLQVARGVLLVSRRPPHPKFVVIPLELRNPAALAALAIITTAVPGTVWSELAADRGSVRLHVFDVDDEVAFIAMYKSRYERPLLEIFG